MTAPSRLIPFATIWVVFEGFLVRPRCLISSIKKKQCENDTSIPHPIIAHQILCENLLPQPNPTPNWLCSLQWQETSAAQHPWMCAEALRRMPELAKNVPCYIFSTHFLTISYLYYFGLLFQRLLWSCLASVIFVFPSFLCIYLPQFHVHFRLYRRYCYSPLRLFVLVFFLEHRVIAIFAIFSK